MEGNLFDGNGRWDVHRTAEEVDIEATVQYENELQNNQGVVIKEDISIYRRYMWSDHANPGIITPCSIS